MPEQHQIQIFLSYTNRDQDRVLPIYEYLIENGYPNAWIDCRKLLPGQPWEFEIQRSLRKSEIIIIFLSNVSVNKRGYVQKELKIALKYFEEKISDDIYIIPVKLDSDVAIPDELSGIQYLDLNSPNSLSTLKQSLDEQTQKLGFEVIQGDNNLDEIHTIKKVVKESWEGLPGYDVEFSVPVLHSTEFSNIAEITKIIEAKYLKVLQSHRATKLSQSSDWFSWSQNEFIRTDTYDAHYESIFHRNTFLSIKYLVQWYGAGAAHHNYHFDTFNFLLKPLLEIENVKTLFNEPDRCFDKIVGYVRERLLEKRSESDDGSNDDESRLLLSEEWVTEGTKNWDSLSAFSFSAEGIIFSFPPYQVGSFADGYHSVEVPYDFLHDDLQRYISQALLLSF